MDTYELSAETQHTWNITTQNGCKFKEYDGETWEGGRGTNDIFCKQMDPEPLYKDECLCSWIKCPFHDMVELVAKTYLMGREYLEKIMQETHTE